MFGEFPQIFRKLLVLSREEDVIFGWGWCTARCWMKLESFMVEVWLSKKWCG